MTGWPTGYAIHEREVTPERELVEALRGVPTRIVSDCLGSMLLGAPRLPQLLVDVREKQAQEEKQQRHHDDERVDAILRTKGCPV